MMYWGVILSLLIYIFIIAVSILLAKRGIR